MQGLIETGGSSAPANARTYDHKRYMPTLAAFMVPAVVAGLAAAFVYADAKPRVAPTIDLAVRAEMVRYAAQKVPTVDGAEASLARTLTEHTPLDNVGVVAASEMDLATR